LLLAFDTRHEKSMIEKKSLSGTTCFGHMIAVVKRGKLKPDVAQQTVL
jgi:hypothetical protein